MVIDFTEYLNANPVLNAQIRKYAEETGKTVEEVISSFFSSLGRSTQSDNR